jgi:hypothetical protein
MPNLDDTQLVILSAAAQRADRMALPLPKSLNLDSDAADVVLERLRKRKLLATQSCAHGAVAWRKPKDGRRFTLVITDVGLRAIGVESSGAKDRKPPARRSASKHGKPTPSAQAKTETKSSKRRRPKTVRRLAGVRPGTKQALLIDLLSRKQGATIAEAVAATGWQAHSVRGAISGGLKKKLGLTVTSEKEDGRGRVYRISAGR